MRVVLVVLLLTLCACGADGQVSQEDPGLEAQPGSTRTVLISETNGGGVDVGQRLQRLDTPARLHAFADGFNARLRARILRAAPHVELHEGEVLAGAVAYIGCGKPVDAEVIETPNGAALQPGPTHDENIDCFVAVTTVGLIGVDANLL